VGTFGHQRETKRLAVLLRAFRRAIEAGADARLLVAGDFASAAFESSLQLDQPWIERAGYLPEPEFWRHAAAVDVCVNLRYPSAGETSGIGVRMMGIGKPVIFTADAAIASIPETACLRVDAGPDEEETLAAYIQWLARDREASAAIGRRAADHIARDHAPEKIARQYWDVLAAPVRAGYDAQLSTDRCAPPDGRGWKRDLSKP
jgi:glycosyltransferase involved in cell wall biosynthesis